MTSAEYKFCTLHFDSIPIMIEFKHQNQYKQIHNHYLNLLEP